MSDTTTFQSMSQVREANRSIGHHFFDRDSMRFFRSRIGTTLYRGRYFVTSEQFVGSDRIAGPRLYTVREVGPEGEVRTVGEFQQFKTSAEAVNFVKGLPTPEQDAALRAARGYGYIVHADGRRE